MDKPKPTLEYETSKPKEGELRPGYLFKTLNGGSESLACGLAALAFLGLAFVNSLVACAGLPLSMIFALIAIVRGTTSLIKFRDQRASAIAGLALGTLCAGILLVGFASICSPITGRVAAARKKTTEAEIANLEACMESFKKDVGRYPTSAEGLDALVTEPPGVTSWRQYLKEVPMDKWGHPYRYEFASPKDPRTFEITSAGEDGVFGTADDVNRPTKP